MLNRLVVYWVYGGFLAGLLLLLLMPILTHAWAPCLAATFLCLPAYMVHQYEEHDDDRFRLYLNRTLGRGKELLSPFDVFIINVPGVWGVIAISLALAAAIHPGFALIAAYLLLVNAVGHILSAAALRSYNPGLVTAIAIFLPLGAYVIFTVEVVPAGTLAMHLSGAGIAIVIHGAIVAHALANSRKAV